MATRNKSRKKSLEEGTPVCFNSLGIMENMKFTRIAAYLDEATPLQIGKRRSKRRPPREQGRYIVDHVYGWRPTDQPLLIGNPILFKLDIHRKYSFAYEDELEALNEDKFKRLRDEQSYKAEKT